MKRLSLLEQAGLAERQQELERKRTRLKGKMCNFDIMQSLLTEYKPLKKQEAFHRANSYEKGIKGGYGSGKTMAFAAEAITLAYVNRPLWIVLSSPSYDNAKEAVLPHLKTFCEDNGIEYTWTDDGGHFEIIFGSGRAERGHIYLIGRRFYKGPNIAAVGMDEPFSQKKEIVDNLLARVRHPLAKRHCIFWAGTPEPERMQWGYEYFEQEFNTEKLFTVTIPTLENKHLPKEYIESLKSKYDAKQQEVYLCGKYMSLSQGKVYYMFDRERNVFTDNAPCKQNGDRLLKGIATQLIISFDFNVDPMCAVEMLLSGKPGAYNRRQVDEYVIHSSNTDELCGIIISRLKQKYKEKLSLIITGDASGRSRKTSSYGKSDYMIIKDWFDKSGIDFTISVPVENPPVRDRANYVNKLFETQQFYISAGCKYSIRDRELLGWKQNADGFAIDKSKKDLSHLSDAADYGLWNTRVMTDIAETHEQIYCVKRSR